jgi:hypothetical protein
VQQYTRVQKLCRLCPTFLTSTTKDIQIAMFTFRVTNIYRTIKEAGQVTVLGTSLLVECFSTSTHISQAALRGQP